MKTLTGLFVCMLLAGLVPAASAVTVDLSSPQEGATLAPGDTLELALTVANDSTWLDLAIVMMDVEVTTTDPNAPAPGNIPGISHKPVRIWLAPGKSVTRDLELVLPDYKKLPAGEYAVTISVEVLGVISQTQAGDSVSFLMVKE